MQNENGNGEGSSGQTAQFQARGEPDHLRVEAGEGKKVRVEVDGKVVRGKLAIVTIVDDEGPQLVRWEELEAGCLYVVADARATFEAWALERGEVLRPAP